MRPSKRALGSTESETLRLFAEMGRLRLEGVDVITLLEGESDLPTPDAVKSATARALDEGQTRYSPSAGLPELKAAIARKLAEENGLGVAPENLLVTNGAKQAIYAALQTLCDPGDEVVIPSPYWVTFPESARLAGAKPVFAATADDHGLDLDALARAVTRRTKAIVINTPNNPTGAVYPREALRELAALARKRGLYLIADEAYEHLVYDGAEHVSLASVSADAAKRTLTVQTFSKSFSMTGFRVGYVAGEPGLVRAAARLHGHMTGNVCTFAQRGAIAALRLGREHRDNLRATFQRRRDLAYGRASALFPCVKPRGGFFIWADARKFLRGPRRTSKALAERLLTQARVAVVPGSACGREGFLRLSFSGSERDVAEGFSRLEGALCA